MVLPPRSGDLFLARVCKAMRRRQRQGVRGLLSGAEAVFGGGGGEQRGGGGGGGSLRDRQQVAIGVGEVKTLGGALGFQTVGGCAVGDLLQR